MSYVDFSAELNYSDPAAFARRLRDVILYQALCCDAQHLEDINVFLQSVAKELAIATDVLQPIRQGDSAIIQSLKSAAKQGRSPQLQSRKPVAAKSKRLRLPRIEPANTANTDIYTFEDFE